MLFVCAVTAKPDTSGGLYTARQYQSKDAFGRASYGYSYPGQSADAYLDPYGNQVGSYAYLDPEGKEVRVSYVADEKGFRIVPNKGAARSSASTTRGGFLQDTPEVAQARAAHLALLASARAQAAALKQQVPLQQSWEIIQQTSDEPGEQINFNSPAQPKTVALQQQRALASPAEVSSASAETSSDFVKKFLSTAAKAFKQAT